MTIDLTPEELETIIDALGEAYGEYVRQAAWETYGGNPGEYTDAAERCAALSKRLGSWLRRWRGESNYDLAALGIPHSAGL